MSSPRVSLIIVAAGQGRRMKNRMRKPFLRVRGRTLLEWTLRSFHGIAAIKEIILVLHPADVVWVTKKFRAWLGRRGVQKCVPGGARRQDSVWNGLRHTDPRNEIVMIHDAARPCVDRKTIQSVLHAAGRTGGAVVAVPVVDTVKVVDRMGRIRSTPDRSTLWSAQTPQAFARPVLWKAYQSARKKGSRTVTDDAALVEAAGFSVVVVPGFSWNIKVTTPLDIILAGEILSKFRS